MGVLLTGVSGLLASPCASKHQALRETGINMTVWGGVVWEASETICQSVQTRSPWGEGVGGGEKATAFNTYVCVGDEQKCIYWCEKECKVCMCRVYVHDGKQLLKKEKEKKKSTHNTANSWDATNHTWVTCRAGSRSRVQCVQPDSWLLYFTHTPPTHLFYYPFACSCSLSLSVTCTHRHL